MSEQQSDVITEAVRILRREKLLGTETVYLEAETRQTLQEMARRGKAAADSGRTPPRTVPPADRPPARSAYNHSRPSAASPTAVEPAGRTATVPSGAPAGLQARPGCYDDATVATLGWDALQTMVSSCVRCGLCQRRSNTVFGEGNADADLMFIGEGPGAEEDAQGRPFVGPAGQLLTKMIGAMQLRREDVYIANIVKCRPPANRNPESEEAAVCLPYLRRQIQLISPRIIVLLGATPLTYLLDLKGITRLHGEWQTYQGIPTMPTFHPSYLLRSPHKKREAWGDLKKVMAELGKDPAHTVKQ